MKKLHCKPLRGFEDLTNRDRKTMKSDFFLYDVVLSH